MTGPRAALWSRARQRLAQMGCVQGELPTKSACGNADRIARFINETTADVVIAAGGDGTVSDVVQGMMGAAVAAPPALAIIPLGTANNVARSLGLQSCRRDGLAAMELALAVAVNGVERRIDLGRVESKRGGTRYFVGSFAMGMDADILVTRNHIRRRFRLGPRIGGYPLYLWSCALNVLRRHGGRGRVDVDGQSSVCRLYNLLVANTPLYAGEFRFDADNSCDDGRLDLHVFSGSMDYLRRFPAAWRRHVRYTRGRAVEPPRELRRIRALAVEVASPVACQLDGEEWVAMSSCTVRVMPHALTVRVPTETSRTHAPG